MSKVKHCPPRGFKSAKEVTWVEHSATPPPFIRDKKVTGKRAAGIRYERKVHGYLIEAFGDAYVPSPWFRFRDETGFRWCQPDGVLFLPHTGRVIIVECKLQHTSDAWWQLRHLYLPVLQHAFPSKLWKFGVCEIVKWFDPATAFPEEVKLCPLTAVPSCRKFAVHIWKP